MTCLSPKESLSMTRTFLALPDSEWSSQFLNRIQFSSTVCSHTHNLLTTTRLKVQDGSPAVGTLAPGPTRTPGRTRSPATRRRSRRCKCQWPGELYSGNFKLKLYY